jgi:hypothetical protein
MGMTNVFEAKKIDIIVDDDEGLTSFFAKWSEIGDYFCVASDPKECDLYCEFCDQSNGFYSKTLSYSFDEKYLSFYLKDEEYFSAIDRIQKITISIPDNKIKDTLSCMSILFLHGVKL